MSPFRAAVATTGTTRGAPPRPLPVLPFSAFSSAGGFMRGYRYAAPPATPIRSSSQIQERLLRGGSGEGCDVIGSIVVYVHMSAKSTDKTPGFESKCVAFALRKSALTVGRIYSAEMAEAPLRGPLFSLMMTIRRTGPATISALAREVGLERTTLTRDLRSLEQRGLICISAA